jgi:hypothetical protein
MEEIGRALTEKHSGPGRQASLRRERSLTNGLRLPGTSRTDTARNVGNAIIGGSLENRLSHRPAGRKVV